MTDTEPSIYFSELKLGERCQDTKQCLSVIDHSVCQMHNRISIKMCACEENYSANEEEDKCSLKGCHYGKI